MSDNKIINEGIIVKTIDYKETSKIAYIITCNGLESVEFKGANKLNSHTRYYSDFLTKLSYDTKGHFFSGGKVLNSYSNIKLDLDKLKYALEILELSYTLINHITDFKLFYDFLSAILELINECENNEIRFYSSIFHLKTLYLLGVAPSFNKCTECGKSLNLVGFVFNNGGMKCKDHLRQSDKLYDKDVIMMARKIYLIKLDKLKEEINDFIDFDYDKIDSFVNLYYETYMGYKSKSSSIFNKIKM